jgi:integrase
MGSHTRNALTVKTISASKSKKLRDGGGLWLVTKGANRYWVFDFTFGGKRRQMGLGSLVDVTLAEARDRAAAARAMVRHGVDPVDERKARSKPAPKLLTFGKYADSFIDAAVKAGRWRGAKTEARWRNMVENHAAPIRGKALSAIGTQDVIAVLEPVWGIRHETAEKLRESIERVLDAAKVEGHRTGDNPATWRGNLEHVLHKPDLLTTRRHHAAMPHVDLPIFMKKLSAVAGMGARALDLTILTACRSGEARGAVWSEFDLAAAVWTIPAVRTKPGVEHRVPLSIQAVALLEQMKTQSVSQFVFPGVRDRKPLSDMSLAKALKSAGGSDSTVHGMRSAFRDFVTEVAHAPREIAEAALGHAIGSQVERSYARSDALERRRKLMQEWADYLHPASPREL